MMIGLPASGKSTVSKELLKQGDTVYLSSDEIREEILGDVNDQTKNTNVFEVIRDRAKQALTDGRHVVMDATNINRKRRKGFLQQLPKNVDKVAWYMSVRYEDILKQNLKRDRVVPEHVIKRMYKTMQIPVYGEGWDEIVIHHPTVATKSDEDINLIKNMVLSDATYGIMPFLASRFGFEEFGDIFELPHDSTYHSFSVSRHTYHVYEYIKENYHPENERDKELMLWTALLHDIGKGFCKSFTNRKGETTRYANFVGHDFVGSQMAVHILHRLGFEDEFVYKVATLIQFHMYLLDEKASEKKLKGYVAEEIYEKLEILRDADTSAH